MSQLSSKFKVSKSELYNIKNGRKWDERDKNKIFKDTSKYIDQRKLDLLVEWIVENINTPVNIKDIQTQLIKIHNIAIPTYKISKILKENLKYSYNMISKI